MPRKVVRRKRRNVGGSFKSFWDGTKNFLKKTKLLSTVGNSLNSLVPAQYRPMSSMAIDYAKNQGYGRRRVRGGALMPAGQRRMHLIRGGALLPVGGCVGKGKMSSKLRVKPLANIRRMPATF